MLHTRLLDQIGFLQLFWKSSCSRTSCSTHTLLSKIFWWWYCAICLEGRTCNTYSKTCKTYSDPQNYRPIDLLSVISKVVERIVYKALLTYCLTNDFPPHLQFGFLPKRSTNDALLLITQQIQDNLGKGFESRLIALDLSAAFDNVWHTGLLAKLQNCGITGDLLRWFKSYLSNIFQQVSVGDQLSSISPKLLVSPGQYMYLVILFF